MAAWVHWLHLLAAAVWTGGLIVLAALVVALRKAGATRELLQAAGRQFGRVSWVAMAISIATGIAQVHGKGFDWASGPLRWKLGLVGLVIALALFHQFTARDASPAARGFVQGLILLGSLAIYGAAVMI